jgi:hypothetical protein
LIQSFAYPTSVAEDASRAEVKYGENTWKLAMWSGGQDQSFRWNNTSSFLRYICYEETKVSFTATLADDPDPSSNIRREHTLLWHLVTRTQLKHPIDQTLLPVHFASAPPVAFKVTEKDILHAITRFFPKDTGRGRSSVRAARFRERHAALYPTSSSSCPQFG